MSDFWLPPSAIRDRGYVEREGEIEELPIPRDVARLLEPGTRRFRYLDCTVLLSRDPQSGQWHLSISHVDRYPSWDEIVGARYALIPNDVVMAQVLPPKETYLNLHEHVFHLWEIDPDPRFG